MSESRGRSRSSRSGVGRSAYRSGSHMRAGGRVQSRSQTSKKRRRKLPLAAKIIFSVSVLFTGACVGLYIIDTHVANIEYIPALLDSFDPDVKVWKENIRSGNYGDLGRHDRAWKQSKNLGYDKHQDELDDLLLDAMANIRIAIVICVGCALLVGFVLVTAK